VPVFKDNRGNPRPSTPFFLFFSTTSFKIQFFYVSLTNIKSSDYLLAVVQRNLEANRSFGKLKTASAEM
jgi:hypothetical protein